MSLYERLKTSCSDDWRAYTEHAFVRQLGQGTFGREPVGAWAQFWSRPIFPGRYM